MRDKTRLKFELLAYIGGFIAFFALFYFSVGLSFQFSLICAGLVILLLLFLTGPFDSHVKKAREDLHTLKKNLKKLKKRLKKT